jgi:hypothetical protein
MIICPDYPIPTRVVFCNDYWMLKTYLTVELMIKISTEDGIKWICALLDSEHVLMVNDGLLALTLLAALRNGTCI